MLELTRHIGDIVRIGDDIELTILSTAGGQVRFGIKAPRHVAVDREEIYQRKRAELEKLSAKVPAAYPPDDNKHPARRKTLYLRQSRQNE